MYDNEYTMAAARELNSCLKQRCCPTQNQAGTAAITWWDTDISGNQCERTTGKLGEGQEDWPDHDAAGSGV